MIPLQADMVQAILAIHLAMEMEELYAALGEYLSKIFDINKFSCFLFNNDTGYYSLDYSTIIDPTSWDEITYREDEAPFVGLFDQEPLIFPASMVWFGRDFELYWAHRLTHENETAAAIVLHEFPEQMEDNSIMITFLLRHFTSALIRTTIYCEMRHIKEEQAAQLDLVNEMGNMVGSRQLEPILAVLMGMALKIMRAEVGSIMLYDNDGQLTTEIEWGLNDESLKSIYFTKDQTPYLEKIGRSKEVFIDLDIKHNRQLELNDQWHQVNSIVSFPLYTPYNHYGLLNVVNIDQNMGIDEQKIDTLNTISRLAATTIENHHLHQRLEKLETNP